MNSTSRQQIVFDHVEDLYLNSERDMGKWMWEHHVQWVADRVIKLAKNIVLMKKKW